MALKYGDLNKFVRKNGDVVVVAKKGTKITLLKNGEIDSVELVEKDGTHFKHKGEWFTRKEFEKIVEES